MTRAGKYMDEVTFENSVRPMPKPVLEKYAKSGRWTDYFRFGEDVSVFRRV